jgi:hypothetical protein
MNKSVSFLRWVLMGMVCLSGLISILGTNGGGNGEKDTKGAVIINVQSALPIGPITFKGTLKQATGTEGDESFTENKEYSGDTGVNVARGSLKPGTWEFQVLIPASAYPFWVSDLCIQSIKEDTNSTTDALRVNFTRGKAGCKTGLEYP